MLSKMSKTKCKDGICIYTIVQMKSGIDFSPDHADPRLPIVRSDLTIAKLPCTVAMLFNSLPNNFKKKLNYNFGFLRLNLRTCLSIQIMRWTV